MSSRFNIVVASDSGMKDFIVPCVDSIKKHGYDPMIYDLGGLGFGTLFEAPVSSRSLHKFPKKPVIIKKALELLQPDEWLAWIDADCIMQRTIDVAINKDYDVGVTFRKNHLNSGVIFVKSNERAFNFLDTWIESSADADGDQNGLNQLCKITNGSDIGKVFNISTARVKVFDSREYNNFFFKKDQTDARIIHYKSKHRDKFPFYRS